MKTLRINKVQSVAIGLLITTILLIGSLNLSAQTSHDKQNELTNFVNPFIGTDGHGHTYPGASLPHGMVQLSPDGGTTGWDWCSGYHYTDSSIMGFSHTHLSGTGGADYGDILFMPTTGKLQTEPGTKENPDSGYRSRFSHKNEVAKPGYYSVVLDDYKIKAELTVTRRAGFHKYIFPKTTKANIIVDLFHGIGDITKDAEIIIVDNNIIEGYRRSSGWATNHCVYFHAEFSKPFKSFGVVENKNIALGKSFAQGKDVKAFVQYKTTSGEIVYVKVGISHTSLEGARNNVKTEISDWNFERIKKQSNDEWEKSLSSISIESAINKNKAVFYTALYHTLLHPNTLSDADGSYIGMDNKIHTVKNGDMFTVFSLWDTFRAEHPLFTIIEKEKAGEMVQSLVSKYEEQGMLPVWELASNEIGTMIGNHAIPVIADAYFKGIRNFDVTKAYVAMKKAAMQNHLGLEYYNTMGYISSDLENESVSKTLEYAYDDWCIAAMAKDLGNIDDYNFFIERAKFYTNVFDPSTSLMRPKINGKWFEPFDPYSVSGNYTEANAWQYSFFVPHDISGLKILMGGDEKFISKLDELFTMDAKLTGRYQPDISGTIGQYAHGNEPSHHMAYLYNYAGAPTKTQQKIHQILSTLYTEKPDGLCGNEDCGQMSAWYVLSSIGFYPVCPGDNKYVIGSPLFEKATIHIDKNKDFTVIAKNISDNNFYIQSATLNGKEYQLSYITHSDIVNGGSLILEMGPKPSAWGTEIPSRPVSSIDIPFVPVPFLTSGERVFRDSIIVAASSIDNSAQIYFSIDGTDPIARKAVYSHPIVIKYSTQVKVVCNKNGIFSKVVTASFNKIPKGRNVILNSMYHPSYTGGGALGLIDSIKGSLNFHTDAWQGYEGVDFDAIVDLGENKKIFSISGTFLQNIRSWIFFPAKIEYSISTDGINFSKVYVIENSIDEKKSDDEIKSYESILDGVNARYVKVFAKNVAVCPPWHIAAGGKAWLFIDEISIQ
jgi:predicted alpha-1,2-mannosidase